MAELNLDELFPESTASSVREEQRRVLATCTELRLVKSNRAPSVLMKGRHDGRDVMVKMFRDPGGERFHMEAALLGLGLNSVRTPELLYAGEGVVIMEFLDGCKPLSDYMRRFGLIPLERGRDIVDMMTEMHQYGYAHLDLNMGNFMIDHSGRLCSLDFEHGYKYGSHRPDFFQSPFLLGQRWFTPRGEQVNRGRDFPDYPNYWYPRIGVSIRALVDGPPLRQRAERAGYMLRSVVGRIPTPSRTNSASKADPHTP